MENNIVDQDSNSELSRRDKLFSYLRTANILQNYDESDLERLWLLDLPGQSIPTLLFIPRGYEEKCDFADQIAELFSKWPLEHVLKILVNLYLFISKNNLWPSDWLQEFCDVVTLYHRNSTDRKKTLHTAIVPLLLKDGLSVEIELESESLPPLDPSFGEQAHLSSVEYARSLFELALLSDQEIILFCIQNRYSEEAFEEIFFEQLRLQGKEAFIEKFNQFLSRISEIKVVMESTEEPYEDPDLALVELARNIVMDKEFDGLFSEIDQLSGTSYLGEEGKETEQVLEEIGKRRKTWQEKAGM